MNDFTVLDDNDIVDFLIEHIDEFTDEKSPDFPRNIRLGLASGHLVIRRQKRGFAVVARNCGVGYRPAHAELVFLYTDPEARGNGEASALIEQMKQDPVVGMPIKLLCCGEERRRLFTRHGFTGTDDDDGVFVMWYVLPVAS